MQYFSPYVRVNMVSMAEAFDFQVESLEQEIACVTPGVTADVTL